MESYIVSARKYRPDTFDSVVGQKSITETLKNSIKNNQLSHAYLFCGPRGVGKTTCARIFAKTINCFNPKDSIDACDECESCTSFRKSSSFNIHELDAASNNSVEDIRNLIEQVRIPPQVGKYNIYIIDEVHMLSQAAFNAFLKTLEEPPSHAIFVLATTEKHKIIPTILSRCQIFDFNRISIQDIIGYLDKIAKNEHVKYEPEALNIIAQKADGSMRDALSIFDQLSNFSGNNITYKNAIENLNVLDYDYYFKLIAFFLKNDIVNALLILDDIIKNGFDLHHFIVGVGQHIRDLLVCKDAQTIKLLEVGDSIKQKYAEQAKLCSHKFIIKALEICNSADVYYKSSKNQRLHIELALIELCEIIGEKKNAQVEVDKIVENKTNQAPEQKDPNKNPEKTAQPNSINHGDELEEPKAEYHSKSVSIKDALNSIKISKKEERATGNAQEEIIEAEQGTGIINIPTSELLEIWVEFSDKIKEESPRIATTLKSTKPILKEDGTIILELHNQVQADDFNERSKGDLLDFLKQRLQHEEIRMEVIVSENKEDNEHRPYTVEEKYNHMLQKNPLLGKLKQQQNLDFE